jgi:hypothetical protein
MKKARTLRELFSFPGFINKRQLEGQFGDPKARIIVLDRKKNRNLFRLRLYLQKLL